VVLAGVRNFAGTRPKRDAREAHGRYNRFQTDEGKELLTKGTHYSGARQTGLQEGKKRITKYRSSTPKQLVRGRDTNPTLSDNEVDFKGVILERRRGRCVRFHSGNYGHGITKNPPQSLLWGGVEPGVGGGRTGG